MQYTVAITLAAAAGLGCAPAPAAKPAPSAERTRFDALRAMVQTDQLRRHVGFLASEAMAGRAPGSPQSRLAREYLIANFREIGLQPAFDGSFEQALPDGRSINVAGVLAADDPKAEVVAVVAHYDHLGVRNGKVHPGADDNAAAVALLLETARILAADTAPRRCHLLFLCPDSEEYGLKGSAHFVKHPPFPIESFRTAVVMDLVGNDPAAALAGYVFVMGAEASGRLAEVAGAVPGAAGAEPVRYSIGMVEAVPFAPGNRAPVSDYNAFRDAGRPFVFLSCGRSPKYHTPDDTPESLNYPKMAAITAYLLELTARIADAGPVTDHKPGAFDIAGDLAALETALTKMTAADQPPAEMSPRVYAALRKDKDAVATFRSAITGGADLKPEDVRKIQMISVRLQLALWQPQSELGLFF